MTDLEAMRAIASGPRGWWQPGQPAWDDANRHRGERCSVLVADGWWGRLTGSLLQGLVMDDASARSVVEWGVEHGARSAEVAGERLVRALVGARFVHDAAFALDPRRAARDDVSPAHRVRPGSPDDVAERFCDSVRLF